MPSSCAELSKVALSETYRSSDQLDVVGVEPVFSTDQLTAMLSPSAALAGAVNEAGAMARLGSTGALIVTAAEAPALFV